MTPTPPAEARDESPPRAQHATSQVATKRLGSLGWKQGMAEKARGATYVHQYTMRRRSVASSVVESHRDRLGMNPWPRKQLLASSRTRVHNGQDVVNLRGTASGGPS